MVWCVLRWLASWPVNKMESKIMSTSRHQWIHACCDVGWCHVPLHGYCRVFSFTVMLHVLEADSVVWIYKLSLIQPGRQFCLVVNFSTAAPSQIKRVIFYISAASVLISTQLQGLRMKAHSWPWKHVDEIVSLLRPFSSCSGAFTQRFSLDLCIVQL